MADGADEIAKSGGFSCAVWSDWTEWQQSRRSACSHGRMPASLQEEFLYQLIIRLTEQGIVDTARF